MAHSVNVSTSVFVSTHENVIIVLIFYKSKCIIYSSNFVSVRVQGVGESSRVAGRLAVFVPT